MNQITTKIISKNNKLKIVYTHERVRDPPSHSLIPLPKFRINKTTQRRTAESGSTAKSSSNNSGEYGPTDTLRPVAPEAARGQKLPTGWSLLASAGIATCSAVLLQLATRGGVGGGASTARS